MSDVNGIIPGKSLKYDAIVIGTSLGGLEGLILLLSDLPQNFPLPIIVVIHRHPSSDNKLINILSRRIILQVKEAEEKEEIKRGNVYLAPANYHLLIEENRTFSFSLEKSAHCSIPSIDILLESAAEVYFSRLIGIILTGGNCDGSIGIKRVKELGGFTLVQDPTEAESDIMPNGAIASCKVDLILPIRDINAFLINLMK